MRRAVHQVTAILVALALALSGPMGTARSCDRCPVGCPMHQQRSGTHHGACHHGTAAPSEDGAVLKCACGHLPASTPGVRLYGLPPRVADAGPVPAGLPVAERPHVTVSRAAPKPPSEPPRHPLV